jgi:gliding motility-associated-like protein
MKSLLQYWGVFLIGLNSGLYAQSDCSSAIQLCNDVYAETDASLSAGAPEYVGSCNANEVSSMWYTFTVQTPGDLAFIINPNNDFDDYDWVLFDITTSGCTGIGSTAPEVSCNSYGSFGSNGSTGISNANGGFGNSNGPGDLNGPAFNGNLNTAVGQTFALCVMNWSQSFDGYEINFSESSAELYDNDNPQVMAVEAQCNQSYFVVTMDEVIQASSVQLADFTLTGPAGPLPITSVAMNNATNQNDNQFLLNLPVTNIGEGNYTLEISNVSGGVTDACGNAGIQTFDFYYDPVDLSIDAGVDQVICNNGGVTLNATGEYISVQWTGGPNTANYFVSLPGTYTVQATANGCQVQDEVEVSLASTTWDLGNDVSFCEDEWIEVSSSESVLWEDGTTGLTAQPANTGYFTAQYVYGNNCIAEDSVFVDIHALPNFNLGNDTLLCQGEVITLTTPVPVNWNGGLVGNTFTVQNPGNFFAIFDDGLCYFQDNIEVRYQSLPFIDWEGEQYTLCQGDSLVFDAQLYPADSYLWYDDELDTMATIQDSGMYFVTLSNECGSYTAHWFVYTEDCTNYAYIPNSITPDNDGINDAWVGEFNRVLSYDMRIFNRDGEVIFHSQDPNEVWNGSAHDGQYYVPNGIYLYQCEIKFLNLEVQKLQGTVAVLR